MICVYVHELYIKSIGNLLCRRMQHAKQYLEAAERDLQTLKQSSPGRYKLVVIHMYTYIDTEVFTSDDIRSWDIEAKENISSQPCKLKIR